MKPTTAESISKAEDDFNVAQMSYRARKRPSYDAAVFHSQQCAEKYLKARLEEASITFTRTHDLLVLHQQVVKIEEGLKGLLPFLISLNPFAVMFRYPGFWASKSDAKDALKSCGEVRRILRASFGLRN